MGLSALQEANSNLFEELTIPIVQLLLVTENFQKIQVKVRDMELSLIPTERLALSQSIDSLKTGERSAASVFEKSIAKLGGRDSFSRFNTKILEYYGHVDQIRNLLKVGNLSEAKSLTLGQAQQSALGVQQSIDSIVNFKAELARRQWTDGKALSDKLFLLIYLVSGFGLIASLLAGYRLAFSIVSPLRKNIGAPPHPGRIPAMRFFLLSGARKDHGFLEVPIDQMGQLSKGNLTVRGTEKLLAQKDEMGDLSRAEDQLAKDFHESVSLVAKTAEHLKSSSLDLGMKMLKTEKVTALISEGINLVHEHVINQSASEYRFGDKKREPHDQNIPRTSGVRR